MNKNTAIKVQNLTKIYKLYKEPIDRLKEALNPLKKSYHKEFYALNDMDFEIKKGESVGIIGKNGCGKSTLLKMITGVLTPTDGRITVHGKISAILELGAGFNPEMTGVENIYLNMSINGLTKEQTDKKIDEIVEFAELGEFIYQPIKTYSSGMNARLAFGVAINIEPDILIIDEALSVGDAVFQRKCFAKMEEIRQSGATILFVSHSDASIVSLCSRAIWISNGEKVIDGEPKLVTGLYMKHVTKNKIDKKAVELEYNKLEESSKDDENSKSKDEVKKKESKKSIEEFYNPALKSKSTIYYEEKGAKISDVKVTTLGGEEVNVLLQGREYIYSYKVNITNPLEKVRFGFLIKRKDGIELGGGNYPGKNRDIELLDKSCEIQIRFRCELNNGEYFFNAGVMAKMDDKYDYVHRILDAYIVKVINAHENMTASVNFIDSIIKKDIIKGFE